MQFDYPWHDDSCDTEFRYEDQLKAPRIGRHRWCVTHGQWCTEQPVRISMLVHWSDGTISTLDHSIEGQRDVVQNGPVG